MDKRVPPCDARRVKDLKRAPRPKPVEQTRVQEPAAARERSQHTTQQTLRPRSEGGESERRRRTLAQSPPRGRLPREPRRSAVRRPPRGGRGPDATGVS